MRCWLPAMVAFAGCYQPSGTPPCTGDSCLDLDGNITDDASSSIDAAPDGLVSTICGEALFGQTATSLVDLGHSYTTDGTTAIYENPNNQGDIKETEVDTSTPGEPIAFTVAPAFFLQRPRMSPDGQHVFFIGRLISGGTVFVLLRSTNVATKSWSQPQAKQAMMPSGHMIDTNFIPGVPSLASPRHMIASRAQGDVFYEGIEDGSGNWNFGTTPFLFDGFSSQRDPYLSPDGLSMLFVGDDATSPGIFRSTRTNVDTKFETAVRVFDLPAGNGEEVTPAMNPLCNKLYVTAGDNRVRLFLP